MARQINGHVGNFSTSADLINKFPPAEYMGCSANVGSAAPYVKYWCDGSTWAGVNAASIQALVSGGGIASPAASPAVDIFDMYQATWRRQLSLPSPYSAVGSDVVHPSVLFFPGAGWMGYRYWMAYTPYPTANSAYENPCLAVSQDGDTWAALSGGASPLVGQPVGGYNADTQLVMAPDRSKMYLIFRERISSGATGNNLKIMETTNGVTWTLPVTVLTGAYASQDYASPSIWWDSTNGRWVMISHNLDGAGYPMQRLVTTGSSIYSGWGSATTITITHPTARTWWHSGFIPLADGRIIGLVQDQASGGGGAGGALFAAESLDGGLTFAVRSVYAELNFYRPNLSLFQRDDGAAGVTAWIGRLDSGAAYTIHREDWLQGAAAKSIGDGMLSSQQFGYYPSGWLYWDNYNRADGALGTPVVGSALTVDAGTVTIVSSKAVTGSVGNNRALTASLGTADQVVEADFIANPAGGWLIFRAVDTANYYRVGFTAVWPNGLTIQSIVSGAIGAINRLVVSPTRSATISAQTRVRVVCRGRRFRVYVNGVFWEEITDALYYSTGVKAGFQATNASASFDNLLISS